MANTKVCFKCKQEKQLTDFYKHKGMADGHLNKCKSCAKNDVHKNRRDSERARTYDRERYRNSPERREKAYEITRKSRADHPEKWSARAAVAWAIKSGKLIKPTHCSRCKQIPDTGRIEGHHPDYAKPLEVVWVCTRCHRIVDGSTKEVH